MDGGKDEKVSRRVLRLVNERMTEEPVVLLEGPRSVGKSTLLKSVAAAQGVSVVDLDDPNVREAVTADPSFFMGGTPPVCVDEYQKAPIVLDAIKAELNKSTTAGRFVLTGSTRFDALPLASQSLTGRLNRVPIYPFTQAEIEGVDNDLVKQLFSEPEATITRDLSATTREQYIERIVRGGFPLAIARRSTTSRSRWFDDYIRLTLERDAQELGNLRQAVSLPSLLARLAGQTAQVLNLSRAGTDLGITAVTVESYAKVLEAVFLVQRLPAWRNTLTSRAAASPKIHVVDSGIAAHLLRLTPEKLARKDATSVTEFGHLLETFVVGEIIRQTSWMEGIAGVGHWRTYEHDEVDLVIERHDGGIVAFEVKTSGQVPGESLSGLRKLRDQVGDAFIVGVALYLGERSYTFEDRLHVMPVDRLWV